MRWLVFLAAAAVGASVMAQSSPTPVRIRVRHADPWFIKAMLEGRPLLSPEISTLLAFTGGNMAMTGPAANSLIQNGHIVVNPTDNSLWFFPDRIGGG